MTEFNFLFFVINIIVVLLIGLVLIITPYITRKTLLFGIRVPEEVLKYKEVTDLKKKYIIYSSILVIINLFACIIFYILIPDYTIIVMIYIPIIFVFSQFFVYVPIHKKVKELKEINNWNVTYIAMTDTNTSFSQGKLNRIPWLWYIISFVLIFMLVIVSLILYKDLPDLIPIHFDINGNPDGWSEKSLWIVFLMPIITLGMILLFIFINIIFEKSKLQIDNNNPQVIFAQHKKYRRRMGHGFGIMSLGYTIFFIIISLTIFIENFMINVTLITILSLVPIIPLLYFAVSSGQGGCRIKVFDINNEKEEIIKPKVDRSDDKLWIWGLFYFNKNDNALFVEDRFGNNVGFNYAKTTAKIVMLLLFLIIVISYIYITIVFIDLIK